MFNQNFITILLASTTLATNTTNTTLDCPTCSTCISYENTIPNILDYSFGCRTTDYREYHDDGEVEAAYTSEYICSLVPNDPYNENPPITHELICTTTNYKEYSETEWNKKKNRYDTDIEARAMKSSNCRWRTINKDKKVNQASKLLYYTKSQFIIFVFLITTFY